MRKKGIKARRMVALKNLEKAKFTPKQVRSGKKMVDRSEETWNKNREYQIEVLKKRVQ